VTAPTGYTSIKDLLQRSRLGRLLLRFRSVLRGQESAHGREIESLNDAYDQQAVEVMSRILTTDSCCIDVGAHRGAILKDIVRISPDGSHLAFEPLPHLAEELRTTYPDVRVVQAAVSDETGTASFVYVENDPAYSGLRQRVYDRPDPVLRPLTVNVVRVDDVVPGDAPVAFIKIDIEGGELHALRGAEHTIRRCRPTIVFEASAKSTGQYGVESEDVYQFITERLGYDLSTMRRWLDDRSPFTGEMFCENWRKGPDFYFIAYPRASEASGAPGEELLYGGAGGTRLER